MREVLRLTQSRRDPSLKPVSKAFEYRVQAGELEESIEEMFVVSVTETRRLEFWSQLMDRSTTQRRQ